MSIQNNKRYDVGSASLYHSFTNKQPQITQNQNLQAHLKRVLWSDCFNCRSLNLFENFCSLDCIERRLEDYLRKSYYPCKHSIKGLIKESWNANITSAGIIAWAECHCFSLFCQLVVKRYQQLNSLNSSWTKQLFEKFITSNQIKVAKEIKKLIPPSNQANNTPLIKQNFEASLPYFLNKESFISNYKRKWNKSLSRLNKKDFSYLCRRLGNVAVDFQTSGLTKEYLALSTLTFHADEISLEEAFQKVNQHLIEQHLENSSEKIFIFFERHSKSKKWHFHSIHSKKVNIIKNWKYGKEVHSRSILDLESDLIYVTKDWISYKFLNLEKWGLKKQDKFYLNINNQSKNRKEYFKEYNSFNRNKKTLQRQRLRLISYLQNKSQDFRVKRWKEQLKNIELQLSHISVETNNNIQSILKKNPVKRKLSLFISLKENLTKEITNNNKSNKKNNQELSKNSNKVYDSKYLDSS